MLHKKRILILFCLVWVFLLPLYSCAKEYNANRADWDEKGPTTEPLGEEPIVEYEWEHEVIYIEDVCIEAEWQAWRTDMATFVDAVPVEDQEGWPEPVNPAIDPNNRTLLHHVYYSYTSVYHSVLEFLRSGVTAERSFLIRPQSLQGIWSTSYEERDAALTGWCDKWLPSGNVIPKVGFVLWTGTAAELLEIAGEDHRIMVCFPEDFIDIFGMTVEQAQKMIELGELNMWGSPNTSSSPLYRKHPLWIAAYLADHPELLEENA